MKKILTVLMLLLCSYVYASSMIQSKTYYYDEDTPEGSISASFNFSRDLVSHTTSCHIWVYNYVNGTLIRIKLDVSDFKQFCNDIEYITGKLKGKPLDDMEIEITASEDAVIIIQHNDVYIANSRVSFEDLCIFQAQMKKILDHYEAFLKTFESIILQ